MCEPDEAPVTSNLKDNKEDDAVSTIEHWLRFFVIIILFKETI